ncbi:MAG: PDZ domain-containing protein [Gemmataceae bacterium]
MRRLLFLILAGIAATPVSPLFAQDVPEGTEAALRAAVEKVAPTIAKIETSGGTEVVGGPSALAGGFRKGTGPTTGIVVSADGYILTSSFNFSNKPTDIFVTIPGQTRLVAKIIATDSTRMLTLLKVEAKNLPIPVAVPKKEVVIGQWAVAVGRTLTPDSNGFPSTSVGIISAIGRIQGKALQTDAKVSPVNYGGALVDLSGRVYGILVPLSPRGDGDTAGVDWYDSGIGFAIPLEDCLAVLPKMKAGENLGRGVLGVTFKNSAEPYFNHPIVDVVTVESAAAKAGLQSGDQIIAVDGKPIPHITSLQFALGPKYVGDKISLKILRDAKEMSFASITLGANLSTYIQPFLGILPMRDDPEAGVEVRYVFPGSPAEKAGLVVGDRIMKVPGPRRGPGPMGAAPELVPVTTREQFTAVMRGLQPNADAKFEVKKKKDGKKETITVKLSILTDELPTAVPLPSSVGKALEKPKGPPTPNAPKPVNKDDKKPEEKKPEEKKPDDKKADDKKPADGDEKKELETGLLERSNTTLGRQYWIYVPKDYKPGVAHGVIIWLHEAGSVKDAKDVVKTWGDYCDEHHFILLGPKSQSQTGWVPSETEGVLSDLKEIVKEFTVDRSRVVAHGVGAGGQMAYYLGFNARQYIRGVAVSSAPLGTQPKENVPNEPLAFFIVGGDKDPAIKDIRNSRPQLVEKRFPVVYRELKDFGKQYLDEKSFNELQRWLDSLDRI